MTTFDLERDVHDVTTLKLYCLNQNPRFPYPRVVDGYCSVCWQREHRDAGSREFIPGMTRHYIDGEPVTKEEFDRRYTAYVLELK